MKEYSVGQSLWVIKFGSRQMLNIKKKKKKNNKVLTWVLSRKDMLMYQTWILPEDASEKRQEHGLGADTPSNPALNWVLDGQVTGSV